jgi:hypothetical protein
VKFFVDENSHLQVAELLGSIYSAHEFRNFAEERLAGYEDVPLFQELAERNFDAIITNDRNQTRDAHERRALIDARLHWIGHTRVGRSGLAGVTMTIAGVLAGFPYVLDTLGGSPEPHAFLLHGIPTDRTQRLRSWPL